MLPPAKTKTALKGGEHLLQPVEKLPRRGLVMAEINREETIRRKTPNITPIFVGDYVAIEYHLDTVSLENEPSLYMEGLVLAIRRKGLHSSFIVRGKGRNDKVGRIEQQFPFFSPWVKAIRVLKSYKMKENRALYMRKLDTEIPYGKPPSPSDYKSIEQLKEAQQSVRRGQTRKITAKLQAKRTRRTLKQRAKLKANKRMKERARGRIQRRKERREKAKRGDATEAAEETETKS